MNALEGKKVLVTRAAEQADSFVSQLKSLGALPLVIPAIKLSSSMQNEAAQQALDSLSTFDWVIFTSANGVNFFIDSLEARNQIQILKDLKLAVIGSKTAEALERKVKKPDAMPERFISDDIAECLGNVEGLKILLARASQTRDVLAKELLRKGAIINELSVYNIQQNTDQKLIEDLISADRPDYLTFTSSSTVRSMRDILHKAGKDWLQTVPSICIGPVTAKTLEDFGVKAYAVAELYTTEGMIRAIERKQDIKD